MFFTLSYAVLWGAWLAYTVHAATQRRWLGPVATGLAVVNWGALCVVLVERGLAVGHWPFTNRYEFALCFTWAILGIYLLLEVTWRLEKSGIQRRAGPWVLAIALLVATYAATRPAMERTLLPLSPALRSLWLQVHVGTALVGYAAFAIAGSLGWMRLFLRPGDSHWPHPEEVERALLRMESLGFPWLTFAILSGAIWAQQAWGRYWGWDPKETWALITWLWMLLIFHLAPRNRWRGRRLAVLAIVGLGLVFFTFVGVPWLVRTVRLESLHGF